MTNIIEMRLQEIGERMEKMIEVNREGIKQEVCKIEYAELVLPDRGIEIQINVKRGVFNQMVSIPLSSDVSEFWKKVKHLQVQFQINKLSDLVGRYCYALLSNDVNEVIIGFRLFDTDKRYDDSEYNQTILIPEKYKPTKKI